MRRWVWLLLIPVPLLAQEGLQSTILIPCKGIVSAYDSLNLSEEFCSDGQNIFFDNDLGASKRGGYQRENTVSFGSHPVKDMYNFVKSTNTEYLFLFSGATMAYSLGGDTWTVSMTSVAFANHVDCARLGGRLWCVDGINAFSFQAGTWTTDVSTDFPRGTMIESHANRLWVAGVSGNESTLYGSKFGNGNIWGLGGDDGDPVQIPIRNQDGDVLNALGTYGDALIAWKKRSMHGLVGKNQSNFTLKELSTVIGCVDDKSVQVKQSGLFWLSQRGLEKFESGVVKDLPPFGDPVRDITDKFLSGPVASNDESAITDTTESDFRLGVSTYVSFENPLGAITPLASSTKTVDAVDTEISCNQQAIGYSPPFSVAVTTLAFSFVPRFPTSTNLISFRAAISHIPGDMTVEPLFVSVHRSDAVFSTRPAYAAMNSSYTRLIASDIPTGPRVCGIHQGGLMNVFVPSVTLSANTTYWILFRSEAENWYNLFASSRDYSDGFTYSYNKDTNQESGPTPGDYYFQITFSSAMLTSRVIDLGVANPTNGRFLSDYTDGAAPTLFYTRTNSVQANLPTTDWLLQLAGSTITLARFIQWRADLTSPGNPSVQSVSIKYGGSLGKPRMASWVVDGRYYLSGSTNSVAETSNETILVVDRFDNFSRLNGMNASSFADAFGNTYFGTSQSTSPQGGLFYRMTDTFSDNGFAIDAFAITKDYCSGPCAQDKYFDKLYIKTKSDGSGGGSLFSYYTFDRDGAEEPFGDVSLTENTGLIISRVYFPFNNYGTRGKTVRFKFRNNELSRNFKYYGAEVFYSFSPVQ